MAEWFILFAGLASLVAFVMALIWADLLREDKAYRARMEAKAQPDGLIRRD